MRVTVKIRTHPWAYGHLWTSGRRYAWKALKLSADLARFLFDVSLEGYKLVFTVFHIGLIYESSLCANYFFIGLCLMGQNLIEDIALYWLQQLFVVCSLLYFHDIRISPVLNFCQTKVVFRSISYSIYSALRDFIEKSF